MWQALALWLRPVQKGEAIEPPTLARAPVAVAGRQKAKKNISATPSTTAANAEPTAVPTVEALRKAIPPSCFAPSLWTSCSYLFRDAFFVAILAFAAIKYIPQLEHPAAAAIAWCVYGFVQGLFCTGLWILAHECGHGAFSVHQRVNDCIGWVVHGFLLVPYFSWKFTHARHHRFTGHMRKDMAFVPQTRKEHSARLYLGLVRAELFDDVPIVTLLQLVAHQLLGWQTYLAFHVSSGPGSHQRPGAKWWRRSHFDPWSPVFRPQEAVYVFLSDVGILCTAAMIYMGATILGARTMFLLYGVPYLWVHHWLVAITYLHHTHPELPHYDEDTWTFAKGALATVDRDFGFIGRHLFHGIIDTHVVHHLFPRIPFYYAEEATAAIKPLLGDLYHQEDTFLDQLYPTFAKCKFVESSPTEPGTMKWATT